MSRAAITGWAWRTALGSDPDEVFSALLQGRRAARTCFGPGRLGAPLPEIPPPAPGHRRFLTASASLCVRTALEAAQRAGCTGGPRVALFSAVGGLKVAWQETLPAFQKLSPDGLGAWDQGLRELHPFWLLKHLSNNAHALASVDLGARGEGATYGGANSGAQALVAALRCLAEGAAEVAVVMAGDSLLGPEALVELEAASSLSRASLDQLAAPYDARATGFVPGEATAALVLEPEAKSSGRTLAYIEAAESSDGSAGAPSPALLARLVAEIGRGAALVDGAGLAQSGFDLAEREVLATALGPEVPLTCEAAALGQTGAARSLVQTMVLAASLRRGTIPPIAGLREPAEGPLRLTARPEPTKARVALGLSVGAPGLAGAVRVELP